MENIILKPLDWIDAIGWTIIGIAFVKALIYPYGRKFLLIKWLKENTLDTIKGLLLTLITLKLGIIIIDLLSIYFGINFNNFDNILKSAHIDPIKFSLIISIIFQYWLYKKNKSTKNDSKRADIFGDNPDPKKEEK